MSQSKNAPVAPKRPHELTNHGVIRIDDIVVSAHRVIDDVDAIGNGVFDGLGQVCRTA